MEALHREVEELRAELARAQEQAEALRRELHAAQLEGCLAQQTLQARSVQGASVLLPWSLAPLASDMMSGHGCVLFSALLCGCMPPHVAQGLAAVSMPLQ